MLMSRNVSFIMVTDTRQGFWVRNIPARGTTVMKNKSLLDLPSRNDETFNPSRWEDAFLPRQTRLWQPERNHKLEKEKIGILR